MEMLIKVDPEKHMYRWYSVGIQSTLVDGVVVIYGWGSLRSSFQQWRVKQVKSIVDAEKIILGMVGARLKRGYIRKRE